MKRVMVIGLLVGLALLAVGRRLRSGADDILPGAAEAYRRGDYAASAEQYRRAAAAGADTPAVAHNHAAALYRMPRFEDAAGQYERSGQGSGLREARAAYDRGNCLVNQGCPANEPVKPDLLTRAADQYQACLQHEGKVADAGSLFDDARHNLELTKLLLAQYADPPKDRDATASADGARPPEEQCPH
jgi:hypothetical protein